MYLVRTIVIHYKIQDEFTTTLVNCVCKVKTAAGVTGAINCSGDIWERTYIWLSCLDSGLRCPMSEVYRYYIACRFHPSTDSLSAPALCCYTERCLQFQEQIWTIWNGFPFNHEMFVVRWKIEEILFSYRSRNTCQLLYTSRTRFIFIERINNIHILLAVSALHIKISTSVLFKLCFHLEHILLRYICYITGGYARYSLLVLHTTGNNLSQVQMIFITCQHITGTID